MLGAGLFHLRRWRATANAAAAGEVAEKEGQKSATAADATVRDGGLTTRTIMVAAVCWALAWLAGLWCVYGRAWAGREFNQPKAGKVTFESFSKIGWSLALAWVIFACAEVGHRLYLETAVQSPCSGRHSMSKLEIYIC